MHAVTAAAAAATDEKRFSAEEKIRADVACLVQRLRRAINFPAEETEDWQASLRELATNAIHGFWNSEKNCSTTSRKSVLITSEPSIRSTS
ncbi:MAG UNVERIFIED_CONTAM: hypothetical protein LVR18_51765 [Planctomycetaceae bacterium]